MTYSPKTAKKCTFIRFNKETAKRAALGREKSTKESRAKSEAIRKDKIKRLKEWKNWF